MSARVPLWVVGVMLLLSLCATIAFGAVLAQADKHGGLGKATKLIADIPNTLARLFHAFTPYRPELALDYKPSPGGLWRNPAGHFADPGFILVTDFDAPRSRRVVRLVRLRDGKVIRSYEPDVPSMLAGSSFRSEIVNIRRDKTNRLYFPMHPLLTEDGGLILHDTSPLTRIDACGRRLWMIDGIFHHSLERDEDGTYWAAYREPRSPRSGMGPQFFDESIVHVSPNGKIVSRDSIIDILDRNGLGYLWRSRPYSDDPIHLNDIQPVGGSGKYWRKGDLFLSLRNLSMVLLYRPAEHRIVWFRQAPWRFEHDVTPIDDHRISVFDNNWRHAWDKQDQAETDGHNRMLVYDFATDAVSEPLAAAFRNLDIRTHAQGRATPLPGGDVMIEETERGRLFRIAPDGTVRWRYTAADADQRRYELRWSRYIDPIADRIGIHAAENARCT